MPSIADAIGKNDEFARGIVREIEKDIKRKSEALFKKHREEIEREIGQIEADAVARAALSISKHSTMMYAQDRIVIEIFDTRKGK